MTIVINFVDKLSNDFRSFNFVLVLTNSCLILALLSLSYQNTQVIVLRVLNEGLKKRLLSSNVPVNKAKKIESCLNLHGFSVDSLLLVLS